MNELIVRRGERLSASLWTAFWRERRRQRLLAGPGTHIKDTPAGQIISFEGGDDPWLHPWRTYISGEFLTFRKGIINETIEPTIHDIPMSGDPVKGVRPPRLQISRDQFDAEFRSWIVVEVDPADEGKVVSAKILQVKEYVPFGPQWPIAILRWPEGGAIEKHQHAFFNLKHYSRAVGSGRVRHFFVAQP